MGGEEEEGQVKKGGVWGAEGGEEGECGEKQRGCRYTKRRES